MKKVILCAYLLVGPSVMALAQMQNPDLKQVLKQQVTIQGSGVFTRKNTNAGITYDPTSSVGVYAAYRYNFIRWFGVEGDYGFFRDSQKLASSSAATSVKTNVHAATANAVICFSNPLTKKMESFITFGGGTLIFDPTGTPGSTTQRKNAITIGGGDDFILSRHLALRAQVESFTYKPPAFGPTALESNKYTQTLAPSVGIVYKF